MPANYRPLSLDFALLWCAQIREVQSASSEIELLSFNFPGFFVEASEHDLLNRPNADAYSRRKVRRSRN
jgi:hypothetical protein